MDAAAPSAHPWDARAQHQHVNATRKACPVQMAGQKLRQSHTKATENYFMSFQWIQREYSCWTAALKSDHWSLLHGQYPVETASRTTKLLQEMC